MQDKRIYHVFGKPRHRLYMLHNAIGMDFSIHTRKDTYNMSTHTIEMTICQSRPRSGCYISTLCPVVIFARALHNDLGYTHENVAHCSLLPSHIIYYCDMQTNEAFSCFCLPRW